jgi:hypothetical protein
MEAAARSATTLSALPLALLQGILARLPVDARARACCVCCAWNAALAERGPWLRLDLSPLSGVAVALSDAVLRAASARAGGQLEALCVTRYTGLSFDALLAVATANGGALRELCTCSDDPNPEDSTRMRHSTAMIRRLLRAAPHLRALTVDAMCSSTAEASSMLRNDPPFEPLRLRELGFRPANAPDAAEVLSVVADAAAHAWLTELGFGSVPLNTPAVLDAVVDAALARRLSSVRLYRCSLSPASAPALARLISSGLARLHIHNIAPQLDVPSALLLGDALRASTTLDLLQLSRAGLWRDPAATVLLLSTLLLHPTLRVLDLSDNRADTADVRVVAAATLGAVVAANAPALHSLDIANCRLSDAGVEALVNALARNTHLHTLRCPDNLISEAFAHDVLLPAVQANASLRELELIEEDAEDEHPAILRELQDMVAARAAAVAPPQPWREAAAA